MTIKNLSIASLIAASATLGFTSCNSDSPDNEIFPVPDQVFTAGIPSSVDGLAVTKDSQGRVVQIKGLNEELNFNYRSASRANDYDMTIDYISDGKHEYTFYCRLNSKRFLSYALQVSANGNEGDNDEWWFDYNSDGQLTYLKRSEGDNEITRITYDNNGDIIKTSTSDDSNGTPDVCTIEYTSDNIVKPMDNVGCVMMFDDFFGIDMDEMGTVYYAGLLGNATAHCPMKLTHEGENSYNIFDWTISITGLPALITATSYNDGEPTRTWNVARFTW